MTGRARWIALAMLLASAAPACAFDSEQTFKKGTFVLSGEGTYGWETNLESKHSGVTYLEFYDIGVRFSLLPFDPIGRDHFWYGALELGLEPLYQHYTTPKPAFWAGLTAVGRYHFLGLGRFVPYIESGAAAGGTDLRIPEIDSTLALYVGYRFQHVSNANTSQPNRGFEANVVVSGVSVYFH